AAGSSCAIQEPTPHHHVSALREMPPDAAESRLPAFFPPRSARSTCITVAALKSVISNAFRLGERGFNQRFAVRKAINENLLDGYE
ncbi:MAG: hypothetical protein ABIU29_02220, partial [Chthoniobacterales bacterium]